MEYKFIDGNILEIKRPSISARVGDDRSREYYVYQDGKWHSIMSDRLDNARGFLKGFTGYGTELKESPLVRYKIEDVKEEDIICG